MSLNWQIDIVKHPGEIEGKSTAVHAKLLAPDHVNIHIYPDIPDYSKVGRIIRKLALVEIFYYFQKQIQDV